MSLLFESPERCLNLKEIYLQNNRIATGGAEQLISHLVQCQLKVLNLDSNRINDFESFAYFLENNESIEVLSIADNQVEFPQSLINFIDALGSTKSPLNFLNLKGCFGLVDT